jgi:uncharacterized alkaline shock family protein YloU
VRQRQGRALKLEQNGYANEGSLKISEEVLSTIAGLAASEVNGVAGLTTCPNPDFKGLLRTKRGAAKAIHIDIKDGEATLDVYVNLYLGVRIPDAAIEIQTRVKDAVQTMTSITVSKVNVHVAGVTIVRDEENID